MTRAEMEKYEFAGLATNLANDRGRAGYAVDAMRILYNGFGLDENDPIINNALAEARVGTRNGSGHISHAGLLEAIDLYGRRFIGGLQTTTINDLIGYVGDKGFNIPQRIRDLMGQFGDQTVEQVSAIENNPDAERVSNIVGILTRQVFEGQLYPDLVTARTGRTLEQQLAPQEGAE